MRVRELRCVRCGQEPRHRYPFGEQEAFLCLGCLAEPTVRAEVLSAERMGVSAGRAWLVRDRGWVGHWHDKAEASA